MKIIMLILALVLSLTTACAPAKTGQKVDATAIPVVTPEVVDESKESVDYYIPMEKEHRLQGVEQTVEVYTVDEFLKAISPGTSILLMDKVYNLSDAADYGGAGGEYYTWKPVDGGYELVIQNADSLYISGLDRSLTAITTDCAAADLLTFSQCNNLIVQAFTAYHSDAEAALGDGMCFQNCETAMLVASEFYDCATAIVVDASKWTRIEYSEIKDCSAAGVSLHECESVWFREMDIHDCPTEIEFGADSVDVSMNDEPLEK